MNADRPLISVVLNTYNEPEYVQDFFASLQAQTEAPQEVIVVDNSDRLDYTKEMRQAYPGVIILKQKENLDFCRGSNLGLQQATHPYILLLNQDMILEPRAIECLLNTISDQPRVGAVIPKLLRFPTEGDAHIDSMGIIGNRARRFVNRGEGEEDRGQYDIIQIQQNFFGASGAAVLFRKEALEDIAKHGGGNPGEYFDEDFVAYKDDIDISYRLRHRGWGIVLTPEAHIFHKRTVKEIKKSEGIVQDRRAKSFRVRGNSFRNHWWLLIKNEPMRNLILHAPWILWYECRKLLFILFMEPSTLRIVPSFWKKLPLILRKRRAILSSSTISSKQLRDFFQHSSL